MKLEDYRYWLNLARRHARVEYEAEDLLQDALLAAAEQNRFDLTEENNRAWLAGVIRNIGTSQARSAARRKKRDQLYAEHSKLAKPAVPSDDLHTSPIPRDRLLGNLSPAARQVAILALHGLTRKEIRAVLNLSDTALRQRLSAIRNTLGKLPDDLQRQALSAAYASRLSRDAHAFESLPLGLIRSALLRQWADPADDGKRSIGTHDPSGHLIVIQEK